MTLNEFIEKCRMLGILLDDEIDIIDIDFSPSALRGEIVIEKDEDNEGWVIHNKKE